MIFTAPVEGFVLGRCGQRGLHGDQPVEHVRVVVLEVDVEHVRLAGRGDVARHLERHRRLAGALGAADEHQLTRPEAATEHLVQRRHAERDGLVVGDVAGGDLAADVHEHVERGPRDHRAVARLERPVLVRVRAAVPPPFSVPPFTRSCLPFELP